MSDWSDLQPGSIINYDIRVANDKKPLLVKKGTIVTEQLIKALSHFETTGEKLIIENPNKDNNVEITSVTSERKAFTMSEQLRNDAVDAAKTIFSDSTPLATMQSVTEDISAEITESIVSVDEHAGICIQDLRTSDEYTYQHSVDVSILAGSLGKMLGYDKDYIYELVQAGLLHDIGKRRIPLEIINKPDKLTDEEFNVIKLHPIYAYQDLQNLPTLSERIKLGVYEHHEKANGKGYPKGLDISEISDCGQILSIVDVYDALTSKRPYKDALTASYTAGIMTRMMHGFNIKYLGLFLGGVIAFPIDSYVICSDGDVWKVVSYNEDLYRPILLNEGTGVLADLTKPEFEHLTIFGEDCVEMRVKYIEMQNKKLYKK